MIGEWNGYAIDVPNYELTDRDKDMLEAVVWLIDNKDSVRGAARTMGICRSCLCDYINYKLRGISFEMYTSARRIIKTNRRRLCRRRLS